LICEYIGEVITMDEAYERMHEMEIEKDERFYFLGLEGDLVIDARKRGNFVSSKFKKVFICFFLY
jgi:hypothetical protein